LDADPVSSDDPAMPAERLDDDLVDEIDSDLDDFNEINSDLENADKRANVDAPAGRPWKRARTA
jgi:hypothetical protein